MYKAARSKGNHIVELEASRIGNDYNISIYCGGRPFIGEAAIAKFDRRKKDVAVVGMLQGQSSAHLQAKETMAQRVAGHLSEAFKATVCVTCGIHFDKVTDEDTNVLGDLIDELVDNVKMQFA